MAPCERDHQKGFILSGQLIRFHQRLEVHLCHKENYEKAMLRRFHFNGHTTYFVDRHNNFNILEVLYIYIYLIQTVPCESTAEKISFGDTIRLESQSY